MLVRSTLRIITAVIDTYNVSSIYYYMRAVLHADVVHRGARANGPFRRQYRRTTLMANESNGFWKNTLIAMNREYLHCVGEEKPTFKRFEMSRAERIDP